MKLTRAPSSRPQPSRRGSVLVVVLLIAFGLVSMALYFANSMTLELRASDNRASSTSADQAIEGAARYVGYILNLYATNGAVPIPGEYQAEAVPVGNASAPEQNAHFWIIGRDPAGSDLSEPYFGLIDETSKLNLNRAGSNTLAYLPNMTPDLADAIVDWRSTNGMMTLNYAQLGYQPKQSSFESVDELRLVYGSTVDLLAGGDINRNGIIDGNERSQTGTGSGNYGLFEYVTVYSREPNFHADGTAMTNATTPAALNGLLQATLGASRAGQIMQSLGYADGQGGQGGRGGQPVVIASNQVAFYLRSGMSSAELGQIVPNLTFTTASYTRGRVNINTASAAVLSALFQGLGVDQSTALSAAQQLVSYRQQNANNLSSIGWLVDCLGASSQVVVALAAGDYITTRSFQFQADIAAVGPYGRGYRRVKFIFDTSEGTPQIIYRQDLSRLGWALGSKTRETWVAALKP